MQDEETDEEVMLRVMREGFRRLAALLRCQPAVGFVESAVLRLIEERDGLKSELVETERDRDQWRQIATEK